MSEELKEKLKTALDFHGIAYSRSTSKYIRSEITEEQRDEFWQDTDNTSLDQLLELFESYAKERELKVWSQVLHTDSIVSDQLPLPDWVDEALAGTSILDMVGNGLESQKKA